MIFKRFYTGVWIRVILLVITCLLFTFALEEYHDLLIQINIGALIILQTVLLIRYVNRANRDLAQFFLSVKNEDTSLSYPKDSYGRSFERLYEQLDRLNEHIHRVKTDLVNQELFNKIIINHINTGILVADPTGKVKLHNLALSKIMDIPVIANIHQLDKIDPGFSEILSGIEAGQRITRKVSIKGKMTALLLRASEYRVHEEALKLISVQDIKPELDDKEMESWQKLIRILTHEITNSIGPINSTIDTIADFFIKSDEGALKEPGEFTPKTLSDTVRGIHIIRERSSGLLDFVQQFRELTLLPRPKKIKIRIHSLFDHVKTLLKEDLEMKGILISGLVHYDDLFILADKSMIEQVLINLVRNAAEAGSNTIALEAFSGEKYLTITITDDGKGINQEDMENIFVPFYTTKESGSGIGLSLSREIMRLHRGTITVISESGRGTTFTLTFTKE